MEYSQTLIVAIAIVIVMAAIGYGLLRANGKKVDSCYKCRHMEGSSCQHPFIRFAYRGSAGTQPGEHPKGRRITGIGVPEWCPIEA
jgi:hypothetical protein